MIIEFSCVTGKSIYFTRKNIKGYVLDENKKILLG